MKHKQMKERFKEYNRRLRMLMKSEQNAKNKIAAIGALAVPLLRYSLVSLIGDRRNKKN